MWPAGCAAWGGANLCCVFMVVLCHKLEPSWRQVLAAVGGQYLSVFDGLTVYAVGQTARLRPAAGGGRTDRTPHSAALPVLRCTMIARVALHATDNVKAAPPGGSCLTGPPLIRPAAHRLLTGWRPCFITPLKPAACHSSHVVSGSGR